MAAALPRASRLAPATRWALYAGLYLFACGTVTALLLDDVLALLADLVGVPAAFATVLFASPALLVGAAVWWGVVERRGSYTYRRGAAVGTLTALATGALWTVRFLTVWGVEMAATPAFAVLAGFVFAVIAVAGVFVGLPLMYARRLREPGARAA